MTRRLHSESPRLAASNSERSVKMKMRSFVFLASLLLVGCGTLPNPYDVESKFRDQHPWCAVESVTYRIEGERRHLTQSPGEFAWDEAVFHITYRMPGDSTNRVALRRFRLGPEGWFEETP